MISASELRIGNWVSVDGINIKIENIFEDGINQEIESGWYGEWLTEYKGYFTEWWGNKAGLIQPIPLTHDILLKCGFMKRTWGKPDAWDKYGDSYAIGHFDTNYVLHRSWEKEPDWCMGLEPTDCEGHECQYQSEHFCWNIKHLHQLQNLYFALTGNELEIKF